MGHLRNVSCCDLKSHATELVTADTYARIVGFVLVMCQRQLRANSQLILGSPSSSPSSSVAQGHTLPRGCIRQQDVL